MKGWRAERRGGGDAGGEGGQLVRLGSLQLVPTLLRLRRIHFKCHLQHKSQHTVPSVHHHFSLAVKMP